MPKYYIRDEGRRAIVSAESAIDACVIAVKKHFGSLLVGGHYWVSERGFAPHGDDLDLKIKSDWVNDALTRKPPENF